MGFPLLIVDLLVQYCDLLIFATISPLAGWDSNLQLKPLKLHSTPLLHATMLPRELAHLEILSRHKALLILLLPAGPRRVTVQYYLLELKIHFPQTAEGRGANVCTNMSTVRNSFDSG